ncbi:uncharacterized protein I206_104753 [Kwoniella pini CBS 10737]|uniref:Uncharacterized protein n=1 Tax=Kwoniella pini CBS 10737 TaxID=1296096 RepID=A0AAJ8MP78_9TREE
MPDPIPAPQVDLYEPPDATPYLMPERQYSSTELRERHPPHRVDHMQNLSSSTHLLAPPVQGHAGRASPSSASDLRVLNQQGLPSSHTGRGSSPTSSQQRLNNHSNPPHISREIPTSIADCQDGLEPRDRSNASSNHATAIEQGSRQRSATSNTPVDSSQLTQPSSRTTINLSNNTVTRAAHPSRVRATNSSSNFHVNNPDQATTQASRHSNNNQARVPSSNTNASSGNMLTPPPGSPPPSYSQVGRDIIAQSSDHHHQNTVGIEQTLFSAPDREASDDEDFITNYDLTCSQCNYIYKCVGSSWDSVGNCPTHRWTRAIPHGCTSIQGAKPQGETDYRYACESCGRISNRLQNNTFYKMRCKECRNRVKSLILNPKHSATKKARLYCCSKPKCRAQTQGPIQHYCKKLNEWRKKYESYCRVDAKMVLIIPVEFKRDPIYVCAHCKVGFGAQRIGKLCPSCIAELTEQEARRLNCKIVQSTFI